jgi:hypothetical protein
VKGAIILSFSGGRDAAHSTIEMNNAAVQIKMVFIVSKLESKPLQQQKWHPTAEKIPQCRGTQNYDRLPLYYDKRHRTL